MRFLLLLLLLKIFVPNVSAQINYNANDSITPYNQTFLYGVNMGYYNEKWNDKTLADIARKLNIKCLRPSLPHDFITVNGGNYNIRLEEFNYYKALGMKDHTLFLSTFFNNENTASKSRFDSLYIKKYMDSTKFGDCNRFSQVFKNLHTPIWDEGKNGTPVNDTNYFALYVYNVVKTYKDYVKIWEVANEPDFCGSAACEAPRGTAGNWWENAPQPCDLSRFNAPIFYYIRMLRIAYEVIKTVDPTSYVAVGGIGYPSYLDALLRYTDNPKDGSVNNTYPLKGGAYFDVLSYHSYPQYNLKLWNNSKNNFDYFRFSDAVADSVITYKKKFETILLRYGYNGVKYKNKNFIVTEYNIPRQQYSGQDFIGSDAAQRNAMIKVLIKAQKENIKQFHVYQLGDTRNENNSQDWHDLMGLYKNLTLYRPSEEIATSAGVALKTTATLLEGFSYNAARTSALNLPASIDGAAFKNSAGKYVYVLWAKTKTDLSENASANYSFPSSLGFTSVTSYDWDYGVDMSKQEALPITNIALNGTPTFFAEGSTLGFEDENINTSAMVLFPNPTSGTFTIKINTSLTNYKLNITDLSGGTVFSIEGTSSTPINISSLKKGIYMVELTSQEGVQIEKLILE